MSATQVVLLVLIVVAFVLGWFARERRERPRTSARSDLHMTVEVDRALSEALTAFQAAVGLWQLEGGEISPLGRRALTTFEHQRSVARALVAARAAQQPALTGALAALDALTLAPYGEGTPLSDERLRKLLRGERSLSAARHQLLLAGIGDRSS